MTAPSLQEYMNAAVAVNVDNGLGGGPDLQPPSAAGFTLLMDSNAVNSHWMAEGMFAQAYMDSHGNVIIAYDSRRPDPTAPAFSSVYGNGSRVADADIAVGITPQAFYDADMFAKAVQRYLGNSLASHPIYLEGHSLGGAEAQYVGSIEHESGVTFGSPGTWSGFGAVAPGQSFMNYVDYGDAVGNFGTHFGTVAKVGAPSDAISMYVDPINALFQYHVLSNYATDLHLSPTIVHTA